MKAYAIHYKVREFGEVKLITLLANNKEDAWEKAVYEDIPKKEGEPPYSAWVISVTYNNGNYRKFNTCEGKPY